MLDKNNSNPQTQPKRPPSEDGRSSDDKLDGVEQFKSLPSFQSSKGSSQNVTFKNCKIDLSHTDNSIKRESIPGKRADGNSGIDDRPGKDPPRGQTAKIATGLFLLTLITLITGLTWSRLSNMADKPGDIEPGPGDKNISYSEERYPDDMSQKNGIDPPFTSIDARAAAERHSMANTTTQEVVSKPQPDDDNRPAVTREQPASKLNVDPPAPDPERSDEPLANETEIPAASYNQAVSNKEGGDNNVNINNSININDSININAGANSIVNIHDNKEMLIMRDAAGEDLFRDTSGFHDNRFDTHDPQESSASGRQIRKTGAIHEHKAQGRAFSAIDYSIQELIDDALYFFKANNYNDLGSVLAELEHIVENSGDMYTVDTERKLYGLTHALRERAEDLSEIVKSNGLENFQEDADHLHKNLSEAAGWRDKCLVTSMNHYYQVIRISNRKQRNQKERYQRILQYSK